MELNHRRAVLLMVLITLMWSTAGMVTRHLHAAKSFEVTFWRSLFACVSIGLIWLAVKGPAGFAQLRRAHKTFWLSALCWCGMFTFFMMALTTTTVATVLVTMSVGPLLTALLAWATIGHRLPPRTWGAIVVAGAAMAWMFWEPAGAPGPSARTDSLLGIALAFGVPISAAVNWTITQRAHARGDDVDLVPAVMVGGLLSALITLPFAWPMRADAWDISLLAVLGLTQLAIPCILAVICSRHLAAPEISLLALLEVIFGILLAWVGAGEVPTRQVLVGGAAVIAALVANELLGLRANGSGRG
ncbi:MAG: hypothetical protein RLZZ126_1867 [Pseudomonadota bacterium]